MSNRAVPFVSIYDAPEGCIRTNSGLYINVFEPTEEMICIEDIAHALSHQCRFGGHLPEFYSVAQHSMSCAILANGDSRFAALMHDASEAYLLDIPTPIKARLANYKEIEEGLMRVIAKKFGFQYPFSDEVHRVDKQALENEWSELMMGNKKSIIPLISEVAKEQFLIFFKYLKAN